MASYYVWSGATGSANGTSWANAYTTLTAAFSGKAAGDVFYVAHDHAESTAGAVTLASAGVVSNLTKIVCVNRAGSVPPVSADRLATAQVSTTGANAIAFTGYAHYDGIIFTAGNLTNAASITISNGALANVFANCSMRPGGSSSASVITIGSTAGGGYAVFINTTVSFGNIAQFISVLGTLRWYNTASALLGTIPSVVFFPSSGRGGEVECIGVDLSAAGSGKTIAGVTSTSTAFRYRFIDCKMDAAVTKSQVPNTNGASYADFIRSGASGVNYAVQSNRISGVLTEETTIVRSGGASDGTTPLSWKIVSTANCTFSLPFECPPIAIWNDTTGSAKTATIEGIWGGGAVPNDDDVWLDVEYLGSSSSPQGSFVNDGKADLLATAAGQASSSATWGGSTTKFKMSVSFTAQQKGWIYCRVKCAKASSTFYIDPLITLT